MYFGIIAAYCFLGGRLKPFHDVFLSCYNEKYNFFLYHVLVITCGLFSQTFTQAFFTTEIILIFMLAVHSIVQPYTNPQHNTTDSLLVANLVIINTISRCSYLSLFHPCIEMNITILTLIREVLILALLFCHALVSCYQLYYIIKYKCSPKEQLQALASDASRMEAPDKMKNKNMSSTITTWLASLLKEEITNWVA